MGLDQYIFTRNNKEDDPTVWQSFRKVNCLQGYFENNFNIENCVPFSIEKHMVEEVIDLTNQVLENPTLGKDLFPIQLGFFYGNYEYNDWYLEDVTKTNTAFKRLLEVFDTFATVEYYCWW
ncbi:MAG: hypothetical protein Q4B80_01690 [Aerococcaceae bacterium]|nr:hypothetical protein [Aerococcaceae bacterium]